MPLHTIAASPFGSWTSMQKRPSASLVQVTGEQLRAVRAMTRLGRLNLATRAGVSAETLKRLEGMKGIVTANFSTLVAVLSALREEGVEIIPNSGLGSGVRFIGRT